jgi:hypothetical protein
MFQDHFDSFVNGLRDITGEALGMHSETDLANSQHTLPGFALFNW